MVVYIPLLIVGLGAALTGALSNNVLAHYAALLVTGFVALATAVVVRHDLLAIGLTLAVSARFPCWRAGCCGAERWSVRATGRKAAIRNERAPTTARPVRDAKRFASRTDYCPPAQEMTAMTVHQMPVNSWIAYCRDANHAIITMCRPGEPARRATVNYTARALPTLVKARQALASPDAWLQNERATDAEGKPVPPTNAAACKFCLSAALERGSDSDFEGEFIAIATCRFFAPSIRGFRVRSLPDWNDWAGRTHADVLALLDTAIAIATQAYYFREMSRSAEATVADWSSRPLVAVH